MTTAPVRPFPAPSSQLTASTVLVRLLDRLPQLADAMDHDVIPLLGHLD